MSYLRVTEDQEVLSDMAVFGIEKAAKDSVNDEQSNI